MNKVPPWLDFFKINPSEFKTWFENHPKDMPMTFWCLKNRKIDLKRYLHWAREHYKLPSVHDSFFKTIDKLPALFLKYKEVNWSPYYLPISEWENILFVACLEPPKEKWNFPVQFVLTPGEKLEKLWALFSKSLPEIVKKRITHQNQKSQSQSSSPSTDQLENIDSKWLNSSQKEKSTPSTPPPLKNKETQNLVHEKSQTPDLKSPPNPKQSTEQRTMDMKDSQPISLEPFNASSFNDEIHDTKALVQWVFEQMTPFFSHCLWFFIKEDHFFCWRYTSNLKPQNSNQLIDYTQPSIFRIVFRTGLPYHGYTTSSAVNDQFFKNWNFEAHPEHITAFPIKEGEAVVGLLMGIGDSTSNTEKALSQTEKIVEKIIQTLEVLKISIK